MSDPLNFCACGCQECLGCTGDCMPETAEITTLRARVAEVERERDAERAVVEHWKMSFEVNMRGADKRERALALDVAQAVSSLNAEHLSRLSSDEQMRFQIKRADAALARVAELEGALREIATLTASDRGLMRRPPVVRVNEIAMAVLTPAVDEDWGYKCPECGIDVCNHTVLAHQKLTAKVEAAAKVCDDLAAERTNRIGNQYGDPAAWLLEARNRIRALSSPPPHDAPKEEP